MIDKLISEARNLGEAIAAYDHRGGLAPGAGERDFGKCRTEVRQPGKRSLRQAGQTARPRKRTMGRSRSS